ncbi:MAG: hypothetical protein FRX49_07266 [Trebouxia sp. A1-2]|nr:MAG: hypothetical protein FRX49_07266 [Trebouxia sp. A1-2]
MSSSPELWLKVLEAQLRKGSSSTEHQPHLGRLGALLTYCPPRQYTAPPPPESSTEFATERELCWHLCMTLGLAKQHERLAKALAETGINEKQQPLEYRAQAQAMLAAGQAARASLCLKVLLEGSLDQQKPDILVLLFLVKSGFTTGTVASLQGALGHARQAVAAVRDKSPIGQGRANMALGVVLGQLASVPGLPQKDRADYHDEALLALQQAVACDPADVDILYNLALVQAEGRQLPAAETNCRAALKASGGCHPPSWALLALVLSARQHITAALAVAAAALEEAGPAYEGLLLKIKGFTLDIFSPLDVARLHVADEEAAAGLQSLAHLMARVQRAAAHAHRQGDDRLQTLRSHESDLWLELARTFLALQQTGDARYCVQQAKSRAPGSPATHHMEGRDTPAVWDIPDFFAANLMTANPTTKKNRGFLSDGLSYEPHRHVGWYNLGLLHKAQHRPEEAERCLRTAVGLSLTAPVMSFSKLPRLL